MDNNYYKFRVWIGIAALTVAIPAGIAQKNTFESDPKISKVEINAIRETPSSFLTGRRRTPTQKKMFARCCSGFSSWRRVSANWVL